MAIAAYDAVDPLPVARDDPENVHGPRATRVSRAARRRREAEVNQEDSFELGVRCGGSSFTLREASRTRGGWEWAGSGRLTARTWRHLAVTWDGNMVGHYVDGVERDSHAQRGTIDGISTGLGLGCRDIRSNGGHANAYEFLIGTIDEVAIYSRALSSTELRAYVEATR